MTDLSKRSLMKLAALTAVASAALIGCGKKEEAAPAPAPTPAVVEAPKAEPLKIAFAYVGPVGDGGWTFAHDNGRKAVEAEFGDKVVTSFVENVPESADAERVLRDLASQGNKLVFGTTFGYMEPMLKVAPDFADVKFEHATGYKTAPNMRTYDSRTYEGAYMAGVIAGSMTKTNTLGVVASIPIPEVIRNINSFTLGAQSVKAKIDAVKAGLKDGSFAIWKGPIVDQSGKEVLAKDTVADDAFLGGVKFFVKGVEGKVPN